MSRLPGFVLFLWCFLISSCVTTSQPSDEEINAWRIEQDAIQKKIAEEQVPLRRNLAKRKINKPFLWKIEKAGKTSYLLGSMHVSISASELPFIVHQLFTKSKLHVFESDGTLSPKARSMIASESKNETSGPCLDQTLKAEAWNILRHDLLPFEDFNYQCLPPGDAYDFYINMRSLILGNNDASLDAELMAESRVPGVSTEYLETSAEAVEALLAVFKTHSDVKHTAAEFSRYLLGDRLADIKKEIAKTYELGMLYKSGDLDLIQKETKAEMAGVYPELIGKRNTLWLPRLVKILQQGDAFITVGVAHMTGPSSLIILLEKEGYKIQRVSLADIKA